MNRPNPVKGRTVQPVQSEAQIQDRINAAVRIAVAAARGNFHAELGITGMTQESTPSARWFIEGKPDFHPDLINQDRGGLMLGDHTDDELANEVFMWGDRSDAEKRRAIMEGKIPSIAYLTAAKERIRWLSRQLEKSLANEKVLSEQLAALEPEDETEPGIDLAVVADHLFAQVIEVRAKETYQGWSDRQGYVPWTEGGNSDKQREARSEAASKLSGIRGVIERAIKEGRITPDDLKFDNFTAIVERAKLEGDEAAAELLEKPKP